MKFQFKEPSFNIGNMSKSTMTLLHGLLFSSLATLCTLILFRIIFVIINVPMGVIATQIGDLPHAIYNALRFDLQVVAYVAILPTLIMLLSLVLHTQRYLDFLKAICVWFYVVAITLLTLLSIIDLGYFSNFNSHISITFFDFFNEEPLSLIQTIWDDYPVIWLLISLCLICFITKRISSWAYTHTKSRQTSPKVLGLSLLAYITILIVCLRGSVGPYPLQVEDLIVSTEDRINNIIPNAPYMLKKAIKEKSMNFEFKSTEALLKEYSFKNLQEAMDVFSDSKVSLTTDTIASLQKVLFRQASDSLKQQPNVLILCCESWSNYLMHLWGGKPCNVACKSIWLRILHSTIFSL